MEYNAESPVSLEFFLNVFNEFNEFSDKKYLSLKGLKPSTSRVRDQDATTVPARHIERQFMLQ